MVAQQREEYWEWQILQCSNSELNTQLGITTGIIFCHNTLRTPVTAQLTLVLRAISGCQKQLLIPLHRHKHKDSKHWNTRREEIEGARTYTTPPKLSTLSSCIAYVQNDQQFFKEEEQRESVSLITAFLQKDSMKFFQKTGS